MMQLRPLRNTVKSALLALTMGGIVVPSVAQADDEQTRRQIFEQARSAMQNGRWEEARSSYQQLWSERRTYDVALQLGQAEYNLKRLRDAAEHLAYGLMLLPPREKAETADRSRQILALCKLEVGALDLRVKNKGADVVVDGRMATEAPLVTEIFLDPGEHRFEVRLDGHASEAFTIQIDAGQTKTRTIELKPLVANYPSAEPGAAGDKAASGSNAIPNPEPPRPQHASWAPVVAGGILTIVGLSAGVGFQLVRKARADESKHIRSNLAGVDCSKPSAGPVGDCSRLSELASDYDSFGRLEMVSFIVGGVALIGTGTYFFVARPDQSKPTTSARTGPLHFGASIAKGSGHVRVMTEF